MVLRREPKMKNKKSLSGSLPGKNTVSLVKKSAPNALMFIFRMVLLVSIGFVIIYPLIYMIVTSLVSRNGFFNSTRVWIPEAISPVFNYKIAIDLMDYGNSLWATVKYELVSALIEVCACAVTAYGFARFKFKFRKMKRRKRITFITMKNTARIRSVSTGSFGARAASSIMGKPKTMAGRF